MITVFTLLGDIFCFYTYSLISSFCVQFMVCTPESEGHFRVTTLNISRRHFAVWRTPRRERRAAVKMAVLCFCFVPFLSVL